MDTETQNTTITETQGSGVAKTIRLAVESFTVLNNTGSVPIEVVISDEEFIEITADDNLIDLIEVSYYRHFLSVGLKHYNPITPKIPMLIKVSTAVLKEVNTTGSANIKVSNINQDGFKASTRSLGGISLAGKVHNLTLNALGAGNINAKNLKASVLFASIYSTGSIISTCAFDVTTTISG